MNPIADLQTENERLLKAYREMTRENLQLKSERDQLDELYTEAFEMNKAQRIERDNAIKEKNKLTEDNKVMRLALAEISEDGMNKPFPLDGFGAVADAITQAKYDAGEIARAALLKTKHV